MARMVSVIVATRDRARLLAETLEALAGQRSPGIPFEIIIADNASVDDTPAVVRAAASSANVPIVYLREERPGKSYALNSALAHARGDLLVFADDDCLPSPGWLLAYLRAFDDTGADFVAGRILPRWEAPPPKWMSPALYGVHALHDAGTTRLSLGKGLNGHIMPLGGNMAVRREVIERIGGWNPALGKLKGTVRTGEDHEFALRMIAAGFTGVYEPEASVRHWVPADRLEKRYFRAWFYDNGAIVAGLEDGHPTTHKYVLNVPRYLWREAFANALAALRALLARDVQGSAAGVVRLLWFVGYARARWLGRPALLATSPGSGKPLPRRN